MCWTATTTFLHQNLILLVTRVYSATLKMFPQNRKRMLSFSLGPLGCSFRVLNTESSETGGLFWIQFLHSFTRKVRIILEAVQVPEPSKASDKDQAEKLENQWNTWPSRSWEWLEKKGRVSRAAKDPVWRIEGSLGSAVRMVFDT